MNKTLNLVFDKWRDGVPLPNFTHLNTKSVKKFELPNILLENKEININIYKLDDVNEIVPELKTMRQILDEENQTNLFINRLADCV